MKYCLLDTSNLMYRARYVIDSSNPDDIIGASLSVAIQSMGKAFQRFGAKHMVACFDHGSWRKAIYPEYKASREENRTDDDREVRETIYDTIDVFRQFLVEKTNVTVLHHPLCEADDFIARWIQTHPDDEHVIVSTDTDYVQLMSDRVEIFNGVSHTLFKPSGIYYQDGRKVNQKAGEKSATLYSETWKVKLVKDKHLLTEMREVIDPKRALLEKILLGDTSDNIGRAVPPGMGPVKLKPYLDKPSGVAWENLMDTYRHDLEPRENGQRPTVRDIYERNKELVDLTLQPPEVVEYLDKHIKSQQEKERIGRVGMSLLKFCREHRLMKVGERAEELAPMFSRPYKQEVEAA